MGAMGLKSPASRLYTQPFIPVQIKENIEARVTGFVLGIHRWPVNSPLQWPVTRSIFSFDDVMMISIGSESMTKPLGIWYQINPT